MAPFNLLKKPVALFIVRLDMLTLSILTSKSCVLVMYIVFFKFSYSGLGESSPGVLDDILLTEFISSTGNI
jgi:hypothetical protein